MSTFVDGTHRRTWTAPKTSNVSPSSVLAPDEPHYFVDFEDWERMDRPLRYPMRDRAVPQQEAGSTQDPNPVRRRWLEEHDVHTEFFDGGIGCCWFAQQGEQEPVSGETEDEAIEHLARENGLELWDRSAATSAATP